MINWSILDTFSTLLINSVLLIFGKFWIFQKIQDGRHYDVIGGE